MPIKTVNGQDFYNYEIKDARILEQDAHRNRDSKGLSNRIKEDYDTVRQRKKLSKCKRFRKFLYNKENKTSCNRAGKHWGALIFYYSFFFGILFLLFFCYFYGINRSMTFYASDTLLPAEKKFHVSAIPTFTFVPLSVNNYPHPLVWYKMHGTDTPSNRRGDSYADAIRQYYKSQATLCAKEKNKACHVHPSFYGPCGRGNFGYDDQKPCLLMKLNTRSGWRPDAYHSMHKVPTSMPKELRDNIDLNRETLCMFCAGATSYDERKIGKVTFYPEPCYNDSSFPFSQGPIDANPTIAIQLKQIQPGYVVELSCQLFGSQAEGTGEHRQSVFIYVGIK